MERICAGSVHTQVQPPVSGGGAEIICYSWDGAFCISFTHTMPNLLLVDDDLRLRALLETYLRREGFQVVLAANWRQMERVLHETPIDLMVLDLMLPDRNGLEICRDLRAAGNLVPIVMLTAKGDDV